MTPPEPPPAVIRVVVADDEALVRDGLRAIAELEGDIEVIAEAATGEQAVALARQLRPDVVLMDVRMPGLDGIQATRRLMAEPDPPRVLVLTTFDRNHYVYEALKAGASGFLLKDVRRGQLTRAIRDVVAGETLLAPAITLRLIEEFCRRPGPHDGIPPALAGLTPREIEVRQIVIDGQLLQVAIRHSRGQQPPLLLFNGIGANWELAKPFLEALTSTTAIIFDVPGVGGSPRPLLPYRPSTLARLAAGLVAELGYTEIDVAGVENRLAIFKRARHGQGPEGGHLIGLQFWEGEGIR